MTLRRKLWFVVRVVGCIAGLALAVYGFIGWSHSGFYIGRQPVATDPSTRGQERGLVFMGMALFLYCLYDLWSATRVSVDTSDRNDIPPNI
jgi:hypothetical protein